MVDTTEIVKEIKQELGTFIIKPQDSNCVAVRFNKLLLNNLKYLLPIQNTMNLGRDTPNEINDFDQVTEGFLLNNRIHELFSNII